MVVAPARPKEWFGFVLRPSAHIRAKSLLNRLLTAEGVLYVGLLAKHVGKIPRTAKYFGCVKKLVH